MIAFLILAHKNPKQLARLITSLFTDKAVFYVHVDKKSNLSEFENAVKKTGIKSVSFVNSHKVFWASISQTEARLELLKAVHFDNINYQHYVMLSGQSYPIKPVEKLIQFLQKHKNVSFMEHHQLPYAKLSNGGLDRIQCYTFRLGNKLFTHLPNNFYNTFSKKGAFLNSLFGVLAKIKGPRKTPDNVRFYYGIDWWVLSHDAVDYLLNYVYLNPEFHSFNKHTRHACEIYFPTILCGTNYTGEIINDSLHYMEWKQDGSGNPKILRKNQWDKIKKSDKYFARKFDDEMDKDILDLIDNELLNE